MQIEKVKDFTEYYLVNDSISVPKNSENKDYREVVFWIENGGIVEPKFTDEELIIKIKLEKINYCKDYLKNTDWQIIRLVDPSSEQDLENEIVEKRSLARTMQDEIKSCLTLEDLQNINLDF
jgi:hypothetical protein